MPDLSDRKSVGKQVINESDSKYLKLLKNLKSLNIKKMRQLFDMIKIECKLYNN